MAYKTKDLEKKALEAIKENNLIFIEEVVAFLPCGKTTFYEHKLNEADSIKAAIEENKIATKAKLRKKWQDMDNATLNIALYRLCSDNEELEKLTTTTNKNLNKNIDEFSKKTDKQLEEELRELDQKGENLSD